MSKKTMLLAVLALAMTMLAACAHQSMKRDDMSMDSGMHEKGMMQDQGMKKKDNMKQ